MTSADIKLRTIPGISGICLFMALLLVFAGEAEAAEFNMGIGAAYERSSFEFPGRTDSGGLATQVGVTLSTGALGFGMGVSTNRLLPFSYLLKDEAGEEVFRERIYQDRISFQLTLALSREKVVSPYLVGFGGITGTDYEIIYSYESEAPITSFEDIEYSYSPHYGAGLGLILADILALEGGYVWNQTEIQEPGISEFETNSLYLKAGLVISLSRESDYWY